MALQFKSLCSSSSGNCLVIWTDKTRVIIDCGFGSMRKCRETLVKHLGGTGGVDAVVISHMHSDHINYYPLRVIEQYGYPVMVHENCMELLHEKHFREYGFGSLKLQPFCDKEFEIGDLRFQPFKVPHHPDFPTFGFVIKYRQRNGWQKAVVVADFNKADGLLEHFTDADFIYVESNHDLALLKKYFNYNSLYHMSNPKTAELICCARRQSKKAPKAVMLGHISSQRNSGHIAIKEVAGTFKKSGLEMDFELLAAPLYDASDTVQIL